MTNRNSLKVSMVAAALLALSLPVVAAAQWGDRNRDSGRYDERYLRDSVQRLDRLAKDFERDLDRALDRSRVDGTQREDRINAEAHQFRNAVGDLKSHVGNGRDLNRSADEARRVLQQAQQVDRIARPRWFDGRLGSQWSQIQRELQVIGDAYGFRTNGNYGRDNNNRRNNNDDWRRRTPFPR